MNKYESVCILAQACTDEQVANIIVKIQNKIREFYNKEINIENLGRKRLAYEIKGNKEGIYIIIKFKANLENIKEIERFYRTTEGIIKFMVVREE